jgi:hypothetical protein
VSHVAELRALTLTVGVCRPVKDGWYDRYFDEHIHLEDASEPKFQRTCFFDAAFLQAVCHLMVGADVPIDGHFRESSSQAYFDMMGIAGLRPAADIEADPGVYQELLGRIAVSGFAGVPLGCH